MTDRRSALLGGFLGAVLAVLALVTLCSCGGRAIADDMADEPVSASVVVVFVVGPQGGYSIGSGVNTESGLLTARHVVMGSRVIWVRSKARKVYLATGWSELTGGDTATILFPRDLDIPKLPTGKLKGPRHVRCVAYWGRARDEGYLVDIRGTAWPDGTEVLRNGWPGPWIQTSIPLQAGMSGSPLLDGRMVVGLASMRLDQAETTIFAGVVR